MFSNWRVCRIASAALIAGSIIVPAVAQDDEHFQDPENGVSVWLPVPPRKETGTHDIHLGDGKTLTVPALIYAAKDDHNSYSVTVADLKNTPADYPGAVNLALDEVRRQGDVKLDLETSVSSSACGRDVVVKDRDGNQSIYALFFQNRSNHKLYVFQAKSLSPARVDEGSADALRFQQSVDFIGSGAVKDVPESEDDRRWDRYYFFGSRFSMRFPARPVVQLGTYRTAKGVKVNTLAYTVKQKTGFYRVTIADLWHTPADDLSAIDQAVERLGSQHKIASLETVNIQGGQCGRDLRFADNGSATSISTVVFPTVSHWLYIIEARSFSPDATANAADLARFRKSLRLYWKLDGSAAN